MMSLKEKFMDAFAEMEDDRDKWLEFQKKCDMLKEKSIEKMYLKLKNIILDFIIESKNKDFGKIEECLDEFFKCEEIDKEFKDIVLFSMFNAIDEFERNELKVNIFMK